jgi:glutathione S-transferase
MMGAHAMQLIGSTTSPYVRKTRVYIAESRTKCDFVPVDAWQPDAKLLAVAPLGKVPVLIRDDGRSLYDSLLVIEYLDSLLPEAQRLLPSGGEARWEVLRLQALAHGLIDATVFRLLDVRRPEALRSLEVQAREETRIARTLDYLEKSFDGCQWACLERFTLADVVLGVALQYIDFRYAHDWRAGRPGLAAWAAAVHRRPSFANTLPPGFTPAA